MSKENSKKERCPKCGNKLWETEEMTFYFNRGKSDGIYQAVGKIYWCADGCSLDCGCGYTEVELED